MAQGYSLLVYMISMLSHFNYTIPNCTKRYLINAQYLVLKISYRVCL